MFFDVDIERVEKQPAVRRIGAAIARAVVEQRVQRIEADAVGAEMIGEFDQAGEVGEIAHAPIARRADAVKLDREQPAAVEIAAKRPSPAPTISGTSSVVGGIGQLQPVDAQRQVRAASRWRDRRSRPSAITPDPQRFSTRTGSLAAAGSSVRAGRPERTTTGPADQRSRAPAAAGHRG